MMDHNFWLGFEKQANEDLRFLEKEAWDPIHATARVMGAAKGSVSRGVKSVGEAASKAYESVTQAGSGYLKGLKNTYKMQEAEKRRALKEQRSPRSNEEIIKSHRHGEGAHTQTPIQTPVATTNANQPNPTMQKNVKTLRQAPIPQEPKAPPPQKGLSTATKAILGIGALGTAAGVGYGAGAVGQNAADVQPHY
jgi:hypothetical protein